MSSKANDLDSKIYVAGHGGMVGAALVRELRKQGYKNIVTRTHQELDLINQKQVADFFITEKPDLVYLAAAKVGGIHANNTYPADFIYENLMIQSNVIHQSFLNGVKKLLFLGSSCIYPKHAPQPIKEDALLTGPLESTNEPYAIAKIAGIKMIESYNRQYANSKGVDYRSIMPTNLYGPGDNYHPENSHVIPALIQRFHNAKVKNIDEVEIWGSGKPKREFLYVDDMARASIFMMGLKKETLSNVNGSLAFFMNAGSNFDISIEELAEAIKEVTGYGGEIRFDKSKPDGTIQKLMSSKFLNDLGWFPEVPLKNGLHSTYTDYVEKIGKVKENAI
jgi:GDP-L-fucose synthase